MAVTYNIKGTTNPSFKIGKKGVVLSPADNTSETTITLPNTTGTLALTSDITSETFTSLVQDTTPQLGGSLDLNSNAITGTGHLEPVAGTTYTPPTGSGSDTSTSTSIALRRGQEISIGHNGYVRNLIQSSTSDGDIQIGDGSTGLFGDVLIQPGSSSSVKLGYDGDNYKLQTINNGIQTTGTVNVNGAYTLPTSDGSALQFLQTDGFGSLSFATVPMSVVEDTTPQLGGTLDANGNVIDMGNNNITDTKVGQWDTAYSWGDHSTQNYLSGDIGFPHDLGDITTSASDLPPGVNSDLGSITDGDRLIGVVQDFGGLTDPYTDTGILNVVEDTTPQLGGDLDAQSNQITAVSKLEITNTSTDDSLLITTTEDSNSAAPVITLKRNSSSPADADYLGQIKFKGENDLDQERVYAKITGKISDVTNTTEDGLIEFALRKAGSNNIGARLTSTELKLINGTGLEVAGLTYPTSDGNNGQVIKTNGSGTLSMGDVNQDTVNALSAAASVALDPTTGGIQTITLGQTTTFTLSNWSTGHRMTLMIDDGSGHTVTWPTMQWAGGVAPTLGTSGYNTIELWYVGSTLYGAYVGNMS